ncbi:hypothetical protein ACFL6P_09740 [Candidatus Latescibacterota bacterium]
MPLTKQEYDDLIARSDAGEICFMFDPTQCKDFLLKLDNAEALSSLGNSLRFESRVVRFIVSFLEPISLLVAIVASFVWLKWWGLLVAPVVFIIWFMIKSMSSGGIQRIIGPFINFALGVVLAVVFREQGPGLITFIIAMSVLYLLEKMLYALPVLFFSFLVSSNYELVNVVYGLHVDEFNRNMGIPLMWYIETPEGKIPRVTPKLPSRLFLTLYCFFDKECRTKAFSGRDKTHR